jgi:hypothetical protein
MTPLVKTLKRALRIGGRDYVVTLTPGALKITHKGRRLGLELTWADLISGDAALAMALQASVGRLQSAGPQTVSSRGARPKTRVKARISSSRPRKGRRSR